MTTQQTLERLHPLLTAKGIQPANFEYRLRVFDTPEFFVSWHDPAPSYKFNYRSFPDAEALEAWIASLPNPETKALHDHNTRLSGSPE